MARVGTGLVLVVGLTAAAPLLISMHRQRSGRPVVVLTAPVRRVARLNVTLKAPGRVASLNNTEIRCDLARLVVQGGVSSDGSSTILTLIPDGTTVKKGEVLCELDASNYEELVRRQEIGVQKAQAEHLQAELNLAIAQINLTAYRDGTLLQSEQQFQGQIALARSSLGRQVDRVAWARRMFAKGYFSRSQVVAEEEQVIRLKMTLDQTLTSFANFRRFSIPKDVRGLESQVEGARATLSFQSTRLKLEEDRLAFFKEQVEKCKVRAPHDGFVIYANEPGETPKVFEGAMVRQRLRLFTLPDFSQMEVQAMLHETIVDHVRAGMPAKIHIEALPGRLMTGRVTSISQLPLLDRSRESSHEVKYYVGKIQLDRVIDGLRPGMTAEVEILTATRPDALAIPPDALRIEGGREFCYVLRGDGGFVRRPVKIGQRNYDLLEVAEGLAEGEQVALKSTQVAPAQSPPSVAESTHDGNRPGGRTYR